MYCNQCGGQIKDTANFCKYCGSKIKPKAVKEESTLKEQPQATSFSRPEYPRQESLYSQPSSNLTVESYNEPKIITPVESSVFRPDPEEMTMKSTSSGKTESISEELIDILYSRERELDIKQELTDLLAEIEKIEQRLEVGLITNTDAADQIKDKQSLVQALREERKSLRIEKLPLEQMIEDKVEYKDKLDKLNEMYNNGKISHESVFKKLKTEYQEKLSGIDSNYDQTLTNYQFWLSDLEYDVQKLREDIDLALTKASLNEITEEDAENVREENEIEIYKKELAYHGLKAILEGISKN